MNMGRKGRLAVGLGSLVSLASGSILYGAMKPLYNEVGSIRSEIATLGGKLSNYRTDLDNVEMWDTTKSSVERSDVVNKIVGAMSQTDFYKFDVGELKHNIDQLMGPFLGTVVVGSVLGAIYLKSGGAEQIKNKLRRTYEVLTS